MLGYIIRRLLISLPVLLGVTVIIFVLADAMPGDAVGAMISPNNPASDELIAMRRGQLGLDKPLAVQYLDWLGQLMRGNLGFSFITGASVTDIISNRLPATLLLMGSSLLFSVVVGMILGVVSALRQNSWLDYVLTVFGFIGLSVPVFFFALLLIFVFGLNLRWFPTAGMGTPGDSFTWSDTLRHLVLPGLSLGLLRITLFMRYTRASVLEVMREDYVRTAKAKGVFRSALVSKHILRNALIPITTIIGVALPLLFSGAVIIETIFQWPGTGSMFITAVNQRDAPIIMGFVLVAAVFVLLSNLLTDVLYSWIDPRIRYG